MYKMARKKQSQRQRQSQRQTVIVKVGEVKSKRRARRRRAPKRSGGGEQPLIAPIQMPIVSYQTGYGSFPLIQGSSAPPAPEPFPYKAVAEIKKPVMEDVGVGTHGFVEISAPIGTEEVFRKPVAPEKKEIKMMEREDIASIKLGESRFNFEPVREERIEMPRPVGVLPSVGLETERPFIVDREERDRESEERVKMMYEDISSPFWTPRVQSDEPFGGVPQGRRSDGPPLAPEPVAPVPVRRRRQNLPTKAELVEEYKRIYGRNPSSRMTKTQIYVKVLAGLERRELG